jgi:electron transfer flavoprotein beta subunit
VDLILCGIQGIDYYQAATGTMVAQMLDIPNISGVTKLEYNNGTLKAKRQIEGGLQTIETSTPALITCQKDMNRVRFPALKDIMMSKRKPFTNKTVESVESNDIKTSESSLPPARDGGEIIEGETAEEKVNKLIEKLKMEAKVI